MTNLSPETEEELQTFLCEHFDLLELTHLARGVLAEEPLLIHSLPLESPSSAMALAEAFINVLKRHGFLDDEFFHALCAARPRLRDKITHIWEDVRPGGSTTPVKRASTRIRICLDVELESLSIATLAKILIALYGVAEITRIVIESVTRGSSILVLRGEHAEIERVSQKIAEGSVLAGFRVSWVERVTLLPKSRPPHVHSRLNAASYDQLDDRALLAGWRAGERELGGALFRRYQKPIENFWLS